MGCKARDQCDCAFVTPARAASALCKPDAAVPGRAPRDHAPPRWQTAGLGRTAPLQPTHGCSNLWRCNLNGTRRTLHVAIGACKRGGASACAMVGACKRTGALGQGRPHHCSGLAQSKCRSKGATIAALRGGPGCGVGQGHRGPARATGRVRVPPPSATRQPGHAAAVCAQQRRKQGPASATRVAGGLAASHRRSAALAGARRGTKCGAARPRGRVRGVQCGAPRGGIL